MIFSKMGVFLYLTAVCAPTPMILFSKNVPGKVRGEWALYCLASVAIFPAFMSVFLMFQGKHPVFILLATLVAMVLTVASPWSIFYRFNQRYLENSMTVDRPNRTIFVKTDYPKTRLMNVVCAVFWLILVATSYSHTDHANLRMAGRIEYLILFATFIFTVFSLSAGSNSKVRTAAFGANLISLTAWCLHIGILMRHGSQVLAVNTQIGLLGCVIPGLINIRALRALNTRTSAN